MAGSSPAMTGKLLRDHRLFRAVSADGTGIVCEVVGSGPPLILIHGTADDRLGFDRVAPLLMDRFTLYMMDRRGRGLSGDAPDYVIEREYEDVAAVARALAASHGRPIDLFAHSYGALCAIGAARLTPDLGRLMLYEPPPGTKSDQVERMVALTAAGDLEAVMRIQFCELQRQPAAVFDRLKSDPARWARYLGFAGTIAREFVNARRVHFGAGEFTDRAAPVRFLVGEKSLELLQTRTREALSAFPGAERVVLLGQAHAALRQAPEMVAAEIMGFFD